MLIFHLIKNISGIGISLNPVIVYSLRYKFLAERCWSELVELRPSLEVIMNELENLQKNLCPQVRRQSTDMMNFLYHHCIPVVFGEISISVLLSIDSNQFACIQYVSTH